jgi:hypothetical protein
MSWWRWRRPGQKPVEKVEERRIDGVGTPIPRDAPPPLPEHLGENHPLHSSGSSRLPGWNNPPQRIVGRRGVG